MSNVKKAMKLQGLKYFSQLTPQQKQDTVINIRIIRNGLENLPKNLAIEILKNKDLDLVIKEIDNISKELHKKKMFVYKPLKCYIPVNGTVLIN